MDIPFEFFATGRLEAEEFAEEEVGVPADATENGPRFQDHGSQTHFPGTRQEVYQWLQRMKFAEAHNP